MHHAQGQIILMVRQSSLCDFCPEFLQLVLGHDILGVQFGGQGCTQEWCCPPHPVVLPEPAKTGQSVHTHILPVIWLQLWQ